MKLQKKYVNYGRNCKKIILHEARGENPRFPTRSSRNFVASMTNIKRIPPFLLASSRKSSRVNCISPDDFFSAIRFHDGNGSVRGTRESRADGKPVCSVIVQRNNKNDSNYDDPSLYKDRRG